MPEHDKVIYTGPIDKFFDYRFGELEYKTTRFEHMRCGDEVGNIENFQGVAIVNYTDKLTPYTRIIEHKHFEKSESDRTWITFEFPTEYKADKTEPYYPVNDTENNARYQQYKELALQRKNIIFGGRLAEYKYYDMHQVIESALNTVEDEIKRNNK
jgi:UDP-galactopyranose mutase